jgi:phage shock protein PspC (stress-responsive transcriptional regulator)
MVAGVCGGLAGYFDVNPAYFRVGFVVLALLGGAGILIYGAALLVIPEDGEKDSIATQILRDHRRQPLALIALAVVAVAGLALLSHATLWPDGDAAWVLLLIAGGIILWTQRREGDGRPRILRTGLIALGSVLALVLVLGAVFATVSGVHVSRGVGERNYHPESYLGLQRQYKLGVGSLEIDLKDVKFPPGVTRVVADVGVGHIVIIVPKNVSVRADATARFGEVNVFDRRAEGRHSKLTAESLAGGANPRLFIHAHVGSGQVEIRRALG